MNSATFVTKGIPLNANAGLLAHSATSLRESTHSRLNACVTGTPCEAQSSGNLTHNFSLFAEQLPTEAKHMVDRSIDHPLQPKRRWFLKTALAIGAVGSTLGGLVYWHRGMSDGKLTEHGRDVFRGMTIGIVGAMLPKDPAQREATLQHHLDEVERFLAGMPSALLMQVNALAGLLGNLPTRKMLTGLGSSWSDASDEDIAKAMETMRLNPLPSTRLTYQVMRSIVCMTFFSNSAHWSLTGYPGPVQI